MPAPHEEWMDGGVSPICIDVETLNNLQKICCFATKVNSV